MHRRLFLAVAAALALAATGLAQRVRAVAPIGTIGTTASPDEDRGVPVRMLENPNLDRYLRAAQSFLDQDNYVAAIEVLQDVIQGRTIEFLGSSEEFAPPGAAAGAGKDPEPAAREEVEDVESRGVTSATELDAANSVFSEDGRLYRPVRRLCHELLADMPETGLELYRTLHEVEARELLEAALASGSVPELEHVVNRFFITLPAGRAMVVLADRFLHEGRYRAAVQVLRDLIEVYPARNLPRIDVDPIWCEFKIALALRMAGETAAAHEAVREIAAAHPDESLRIRGELQTVRDLPELPIFADEMIALIDGALTESRHTWLAEDIDRLVPLWQYRFVDPRPYRSPKSNNNSRNRFSRLGQGQRYNAMPYADRYGPASWLHFGPGEAVGDPPRTLFFDHYRLRVADARTGLLLSEGDGIDAPSKPRQGYPRIRIAAVDHAAMRPVEDAERRYALLGYQKPPTQRDTALKTTTLVAYDRRTMAPVWRSTDWLDGDNGLRDVTFLAAPTIFGERLLLPAMRQDVYSLECIDRRTGRPTWHTLLHSGGTPFYKAPGTPVAVSGGVAFVLTNAGGLAAVDAFAGDLRWIRRYEREDPLRPRPAVRGSNNQQQHRSGVQFVQTEITGFLPNDLVVRNGLVVFAGCDSGVVICLDSATGRPVWIVDGTTRYAPYGKLKTLVGANAQDVFFTSDTALVCIGLQSGLVKWAQDVPPISGRKNVGRGRGTVVGDRVLLPGEGEVFVYDAGNSRPVRRLRLPSFGVSSEPLQLPFNIVASGPWLGIGYRGGVEVFSTGPALTALAADTDDPWRAAGLYISAGALVAAEATLRDWLTTTELPPLERERGCKRLLKLVRERALQLAEDGDLEAALAAFDEIASLCNARPVRLRWHLGRVEVCKAANDLRVHEAEQQRLYDFMEGKG